MLFYLLVAFLVGLDQFIKWWVLVSLQLGEKQPLLGQWLMLNLVKNEGAAFSLLGGWRVFLIIFGALFIFLVLYWRWRLAPRGGALQLAAALLVAGTLGNLLDRLGRGYVVDYLDVGWWPVFNLADIMINLGFLSFCLGWWQKKGEKREGAANPF